MEGRRKLNPIAGAIASIAFMGFASAPAFGQAAGNQGTTSSAQSSTSRTDQGTASSAQSTTKRTDQGAASSTGMDQDRQSATSRTNQAAQSRSGASGQQAKMADMRASRLMGRDVRNGRGEEVGELTDMVVDLQTNRIHYAILQRGGVLGIGDKSIPVPVNRFQRDARGDELVLNISEDQLEKAPGLERDADWNDPRSWSNIGQYYHRTLGMPSDAMTGTKRFHRASDLIGMDVIDRTGDEVGEIEDIVVNLTNGQIHYAVLEFDRAWNPDDKLVALPMSSLQAKGEDLTISMTREQLANAPSFETRRWPDLTDTRFRDRVAGFGGGRTTGMQADAAAAPAVIVIIDDPQFTRLDTDRDGRLSRQEVRSFNQLTSNWDSVDRNSDGYLSRDELNAGMAGTGASSGQARASDSRTSSSPSSAAGGSGMSSGASSGATHGAASGTSQSPSR